MRVSNGSTPCGINRARSSPPTFRSIPTARRHSYPTSRWRIARSASLAARRTITIRLRSASLTSSAGKNVELTVYPSASHAFDNPLGAVPPAEVKGGQTVRHCSIREEPEGLLINASSRQPFSYKDPCVELNPHVGYDAAATAAAKKSVEEFVATVFKLEPQAPVNH